MISKLIVTLGVSVMVGSVVSLLGTPGSDRGWLPWFHLALGLVTVAVGIVSRSRPTTGLIVGAPSVLTVALLAAWAAGLVDQQPSVAVWLGFAYSVAALSLAIHAGAKREADWNGQRLPVTDRKESDSERMQDIA